MGSNFCPRAAFVFFGTGTKLRQGKKENSSKIFLFLFFLKSTDVAQEYNYVCCAQNVRVIHVDLWSVESSLKQIALQLNRRDFLFLFFYVPPIIVIGMFVNVV
jgi:hypothetical protein